MATRLFLCLLGLLGTTAPAWALPPCVVHHGGCITSAWYVVDHNATYWNMDCGGDFYYGTIGGDQTNAVCYGSV